MAFYIFILILSIIISILMTILIINKQYELIGRLKNEPLEMEDGEIYNSIYLEFDDENAMKRASDHKYIRLEVDFKNRD